jgi:hypothetical protein
VVFGFDHQTPAAPLARRIAGGLRPGVFLADLEQAALQLLERILANTGHQWRQRRSACPQQAPQVALRNGSEPGPQLGLLRFRYDCGAALLQVRG